MPKPSVLFVLNILMRSSMALAKSRPCFKRTADQRDAHIKGSGRGRSVTWFLMDMARFSCSSSFGAGSYVQRMRSKAFKIGAKSNNSGTEKLISDTASRIMRHALALPMPTLMTIDQSGTASATLDPGPKMTCKGSILEAYGFERKPSMMSRMWTSLLIPLTLCPSVKPICQGAAQNSGMSSGSASTTRSTQYAGFHRNGWRMSSSIFLNLAFRVSFLSP